MCSLARSVFTSLPTAPCAPAAQVLRSQNKWISTMWRVLDPQGFPGIRAQQRQCNYQLSSGQHCAQGSPIPIAGRIRPSSLQWPGMLWWLFCTWQPSAVSTRALCICRDQHQAASVRILTLPVMTLQAPWVRLPAASGTTTFLLLLVAVARQAQSHLMDVSLSFATCPANPSASFRMSACV